MSRFQNSRVASWLEVLLASWLVAVCGRATEKPRAAAEEISRRQTRVKRKRSIVGRDPWRASTAGSEDAI
jgi:hypothetical protein